MRTNVFLSPRNGNKNSDRTLSPRAQAQAPPPPPPHMHTQYGGHGRVRKQCITRAFSGIAQRMIGLSSFGLTCSGHSSKSCAPWFRTGDHLSCTTSSCLALVLRTSSACHEYIPGLRGHVQPGGEVAASGEAARLRKRGRQGSEAVCARQFICVFARMKNLGNSDL